MDPDDIADLTVRWLPLACGDPYAVDAVVDLATCATPACQATTGLGWTEGAVNDNFAAIAGQCWNLPQWLETVHLAEQLDAQGTARWHRLVDGLAAHGDGRAVKLQRMAE